jgi:hypothetical protein
LIDKFLSKQQLMMLSEAIIGFLVLVLISIFLCQCGTDSNPPAPAAPKATEPARIATLTPEQQAEKQKRLEREMEAEREKEALALGLRWQYSESPEKMGRGYVKTATVYSLNEVEFAFPYSGSQRGMLMLRTHPKHGKDVILGIRRGQFICGVFQCKISVKFDGGKPQSFTASGPSDYSTTTLFIRGYDKFLASARKAKKVYIEAEFYQEGTRVFEFDISGLKW